MRSISSLAVMIATNIIAVSTHAAASECRTASLPDGTPAMFCKDKSGKWKQQAGEVEIAPSSQTVGVVPLKATVNYQGTASFVHKVKMDFSQGISLGSVLAQATSANARREVVTVNFTLNFSGEIVSGQVSSSGGWRNIAVYGTRKAGICNLNMANGTVTNVYVGRCDSSGFAGKLSAHGEDGGSASGTFQTNAISYTDTSQRDAERADLQKQCDAGKNSACVKLDQK